MTATGAAAADPKARAFLRNADPVLGRLIDARPDFRPRAWLDELPPLDAFGTLIFQVAGQQLSVRATRSIVSPLEDHFAGPLPTAAERLHHRVVQKRLPQRMHRRLPGQTSAEPERFPPQMPGFPPLRGQSGFEAHGSAFALLQVSQKHASDV